MNIFCVRAPDLAPPSRYVARGTGCSRIRIIRQCTSQGLRVDFPKFSSLLFGLELANMRLHKSQEH